MASRFVTSLIGVSFMMTGVVSGQSTSLGSRQAVSTDSGEAYPSKPVRIVTSEPGGSNDIAARLIAADLTGSLGQPVIVENRGGSIIVRGVLLAQAPPDGHTLLLYGSTIWLLPFLQDKVPYDPVKDLSPVTLVASAPNIVVVHPSVAAGSVKELIVLAKARPGALNYASAATGSSSHLAGALFNSMANVNIVNVPFKGSGPGVLALLSGQVQVMFPNAASVVPHIKSGKLRALAVTSLQPTALAPGLPTVAASGLPGYDMATTNVMLAPAKTPAMIIRRLNQEIKRVLDRPEVKEKFFNAGMDVVGSTPEQLAAVMKSDMARMGKVIKDIGIRAN